VIGAAAAKVGVAAGETVISLVRVITLPQIVAVHVSVTVPPQAVGIALKVEVAEPESRQLPVRPFV
jgi:hypothetical protein